MTSWLYGLPAWGSGVVISALALALSAAAFCLVQRYVPHETRHAHNDVAAAIGAIVGVVYAVVLGFVTVSVWEEHGQATRATQAEASALSDVVTDARGFPEPMRRKTREEAEGYLRLVVEDEWPRLARGTESAGAAAALTALGRTLMTFEPASRREEIVLTAALGHLHRLLDQRRARVLAARSGLQPVVWSTLIASSGLILGFVLFFGTPNLRAHFAMTTLVAISIALMFWVIVSLDYPFTGGSAIRPEAFESLRAGLAPLLAD